MACSDTGGCGSDYVYPRTAPGAEPIARAMRGRVTESGFQKLVSGIPDALASSCADVLFPSETAACAVDDQSAPNLVHFYVGSPGQQVSFSGGAVRTGGPAPFSSEVDSTFWGGAIDDRPYCDDTGNGACQAMFARGFGTSGDDFCRDPSTGPGCGSAGTDYCCGAAAPGLCSGQRPPSCDTHRSSIAIHLDSLRDNVHTRLVEDAQGGGIEVIIGCDAPNPDDCTDPAEYVRLSGDLTFVVEALGGDMACRVTDDPGQGASFEIQTMRFIVRPRVALGTDGRPHLVADDASIEVGEVEVQLYDVEIHEDLDDPACYDESWSYLGSDASAADQYGECLSYCPGSLFYNVLSFFVSSVLGEYLAESFAKSTLESMASEALEAAGEMDARSTLPLIARGATAAQYLLAASEGTTGVSSGALNIDLDTGFTGTPAPCVPALPAPVIATAPPPDPGATVMAPHPSTGVLAPEPYDLTLMMSRASLRRALYAFFRTGNLCLALDAEEMAASSPTLAPTLGTIGLIAPGLATLGPPETAVDVRITPTEPPTVDLGTGAVTGDTHDSHLKLAWPDVAIELYPLLDSANIRALSFTATLRLAATLEVLASGSARLVIDELAVEDVAEAYNELGSPFDPQDVSDLVSSFMPTLLSGEPIDVDLTTASLGIPYVPKLRAVERLGTSDPYLGLFLRLCTPPEIADAGNALCSETTSGSPLLAPDAPGAQRGAVFVEVPGRDELHFRVDGEGPYFRGVRQGGRLALVHPRLLAPGAHTIELASRDGATASLDVWIDASASRYGPAPQSARGADASEAPLEEPAGCAAGGAGAWTMVVSSLLVALRRSARRTRP